MVPRVQGLPERGIEQVFWPLPELPEIFAHYMMRVLRPNRNRLETLQAAIRLQSACNKHSEILIRSHASIEVWCCSHIRMKRKNNGYPQNNECDLLSQTRAAVLIFAPLHRAIHHHQEHQAADYGNQTTNSHQSHPGFLSKTFQSLIRASHLALYSITA